jgi:hypothetical protein
LATIRKFLFIWLVCVLAYWQELRAARTTEDVLVVAFITGSCAVVALVLFVWSRDNAMRLIRSAFGRFAASESRAVKVIGTLVIIFALFQSCSIIDELEKMRGPYVLVAALFFLAICWALIWVINGLMASSQFKDQRKAAQLEGCTCSWGEKDEARMYRWLSDCPVHRKGPPDLVRP